MPATNISSAPMRRIEQTLKNYPITATISTLVALALSIMIGTWTVSTAMNSYDLRVQALEDFADDGDRYTALDAEKDFELRDQRLNQIDKKLDKMDVKLDAILIKVD